LVQVVKIIPSRAMTQDSTSNNGQKRGQAEALLGAKANPITAAKTATLQAFRNRELCSGERFITVSPDDTWRSPAKALQ
jgi:hypothetical protein